MREHFSKTLAKPKNESLGTVKTEVKIAKKSTIKKTGPDYSKKLTK